MTVKEGVKCLDWILLTVMRGTHEVYECNMPGSAKTF